MMYWLGCITGGSAALIGVLIWMWRKQERKHRRKTADWQRKNNGYAIIRSRHRRADRHKENAPMPLDLAGYQMQTCGMCRIKRIGGVWR